MKLASSRNLVSALAMYLAASVQAIAGGNIHGFQNFRFGMSLSQVRQMTDVRFLHSREKGKWYRSGKKVEILRESYSLDFLFSAGELIQINLSRDVYTGCTSAFDEVLAAVGARYGEPDRRLDRSGIISPVAFTGPDGSSVKVSLRACTIYVSYASGPGPRF